MERQLIRDYEAILDEIADKLSPENYIHALELAKLPETIRGYGHIKDRNIDLAKRREQDLLAAFRNPSSVKASEAAE